VFAPLELHAIIIVIIQIGVIISLVVGFILGCIFGQFSKLAGPSLLLNLAVGVAGASIGILLFTTVELRLFNLIGIQLSFIAYAVIGAVGFMSLLNVFRQRKA
jgi:uncharacterized membrane protein YeaQ/YmgE (transglycosylase-associated protein family)